MMVPAVGLIPIEQLPEFLQPLSYALPLSYGVGLLHEAVNRAGKSAPALDFAALIGFCGPGLDVAGYHRG